MWQDPARWRAPEGHPPERIKHTEIQHSSNLCRYETERTESCMRLAKTTLKTLLQRKSCHNDNSGFRKCYKGPLLQRKFRWRGIMHLAPRRAYIVMIRNETHLSMCLKFNHSAKSDALWNCSESYVSVVRRRRAGVLRTRLVVVIRQKARKTCGCCRHSWDVFLRPRGGQQIQIPL